MNLRERKFVNYVETTIRISKQPCSQIVKKPTNRKRACSESRSGSTVGEANKKNVIPTLKRRATLNANMSIIGRRKTDSTRTTQNVMRNSTTPKNTRNGENPIKNPPCLPLNNRSRREPSTSQKAGGGICHLPHLRRSERSTTKSSESQAVRTSLPRSCVSHRNKADSQRMAPTAATKSRTLQVKAKKVPSHARSRSVKKTTRASRISSRKTRKYELDDYEDYGESSDDQKASESDSDADNSSTRLKSKKRSFDTLDDNETEYKNAKYFKRRYRELIPVHSYNPPVEFNEMQAIWSFLSSCMSQESLLNYKQILIKLMTGRLSSLQPIRNIIPDFPVELEATHRKLYNLLCQCSGAYPFKNHEGSRLISQHTLADSSQIAAQILIEALDNKFSLFDITKETDILNQIETYVRIGIKDILEEVVERLPVDRNKITVADMTESLSARLLG